MSHLRTAVCKAVSRSASSACSISQCTAGCTPQLCVWKTAFSARFLGNPYTHSGVLDLLKYKIQAAGPTEGAAYHLDKLINEHGVGSVYAHRQVEVAHSELGLPIGRSCALLFSCLGEFAMRWPVMRTFRGHGHLTFVLHVPQTVKPQVARGQLDMMRTAMTSSCIHSFQKVLRHCTAPRQVMSLDLMRSVLMQFVSMMCMADALNTAYNKV